MNRLCILSFSVTFFWLVGGCDQPQAKIKPRVIDVTEVIQTNPPASAENPPAMSSVPAAPAVKPKPAEGSNQQASQAATSDDEQKKVDESILKNDSIDDLPRLIRSGQIETADTLIERLLVKEPNNPKLHAARQLVASTYSRMRKPELARALNDKLLEYFFEHADGNLENLELFPTTVIFVNSMYSQLDMNQQRRKIVDDACQILLKNHEKFIDSTRLTLGVNQLLGIQIRDLVNDGQRKEAIQLAEREIARSKKLYENDTDSNNAMFCYTCALRTAFLNLPFDTENNQVRRSTFEELVTGAVDKNHADPFFVQDYISAFQQRLSMAMKDDPELAMKVYDGGMARMKKIADAQPENPSLGKRIEFIKKSKDRITRSLKLKSLAGTEAGKLSVEHWINSDEKSPYEFKGKTTLLYFCAVWSRPSINVLPRIEKLDARFKPNGLNIIGVTRPYGYYWDATNNKATRSRSAVPVEAEVDMVQKFVALERFPYPVAMTSEATYGAFGASGVPHFVLIDKNGIIRRVDVGLDPKMLDELEATIDKVIAE